MLPPAKQRDRRGRGEGVLAKILSNPAPPTDPHSREKKKNTGTRGGDTLCKPPLYRNQKYHVQQCNKAGVSLLRRHRPVSRRRGGNSVCVSSRCAVSSCLTLTPIPFLSRCVFCLLWGWGASCDAGKPSYHPSFDCWHKEKKKAYICSPLNPSFLIPASEIPPSFVVPQGRLG